MANLTLKVIQQPGKGRIVTLIDKLIYPRTPFTLANGAQKTFSKIAFTLENGKVVSFDPSKYDDKVAATALLQKARKAEFVMLFNDKDRTPLSQIMRTAEFGGSKGNKGDMAEAIFAIAIAEKFRKRAKIISEQDVLKTINMLQVNKAHQRFSWNVPNLNPMIEDKLNLEINLSIPNIQALTNQANLPRLGNIIQSSVKYANSATVQQLATMIHDNNKFNTIDVKAVGAIMQLESKVDVLVHVDGKPVDINVSLKADQVKQFGQVGGAGYEKQEMLWMSLFNMSPKAYEAKYYQTLKMKNNDHLQAIAAIYKDMAIDVSNAINSNPSRMYREISEGIKWYMTMRDPSVTLVQLSRKEALVYQFQNLEILLTGQKLKAVYIDKANPQVDIKDSHGKTLFSVRARRDGNYIRNVIEKGPLLTELVSFVAV